MALDTSGVVAPVALIANPHAHEIAKASQMGDLALADGALNPADLFDPADVPGGLAVVILNSLTRPLFLVDSYCYAPDDLTDYTLGKQASYPATSDRVNAPTKEHQIPAARAYPRQEAHQLPQGGPAMMGGLGVYSFTQSIFQSDTTYDMIPHVQRALSFSAEADGSGPIVAVAFRTKVHEDWTKPWVTTHSSVTADLQTNYGDLATFYKQTMGGSECDDDDDPPTTLYSVGPGSGGFTIWARFATTPPKRVPGYALTVWVRDISSTLG